MRFAMVYNGHGRAPPTLPGDPGKHTAKGDRPDNITMHRMTCGLPTPSATSLEHGIHQGLRRVPTATAERVKGSCCHACMATTALMPVGRDRLGMMTCLSPNEALNCNWVGAVVEANFPSDDMSTSLLGRSWRPCNGSWPSPPRWPRAADLDELPPVRCNRLSHEGSMKWRSVMRLWPPNPGFGHCPVVATSQGRNTAVVAAKRQSSGPTSLYPLQRTTPSTAMFATIPLKRAMLLQGHTWKHIGLSGMMPSRKAWPKAAAFTRNGTARCRFGLYAPGGRLHRESLRGEPDKREPNVKEWVDQNMAGSTDTNFKCGAGL